MNTAAKYKTKYKNLNFLSYINASTNFVSPPLQPVQSAETQNKSFYLLTPVLSSNINLTQLQQNSEITPNSIEDADNDIDWQTIKKASNRLECLNKEGMQPSDLKYSQAGDMVISTYNRNWYKMMGVRYDLDLNSPFPAKPEPEFYALENVQDMENFQFRYHPKNSGSYTSFLEYYQQHWKFENLDAQQPLLECIPVKSISAVKEAKKLLSPYVNDSSQSIQEVNICILIL